MTLGTFVVAVLAMQAAAALLCEYGRLAGRLRPVFMAIAIHVIALAACVAYAAKELY